MIPNPYVLLAAAGIWLASTVGAFFYGEHIQGLSDQAAINEQKIAAANLLATATEHVRQAESRAADLNAKLETDHAASDAKTADADSRLAAALAQYRLRQPARCGTGGRNPLSGGQGASIAPDPAPGGDNRLAEPLDVEIVATAGAANKLAAYARECQAFVSSLGK